MDTNYFYLKDWDLYQEKYIITKYRDNLVTQYIMVDLRTLYFNYSYFLFLIFFFGMFGSINCCLFCSKKNKPEEIQYQIVETDSSKV